MPAPATAPNVKYVATARGKAARIFNVNNNPTPKRPKPAAFFTTSGTNFLGVFGASTAIGRIIA